MIRRFAIFIFVLSFMAVVFSSQTEGMTSALKNRASDFLISHAWEQVLDGSEGARPWPWIDSYPVAKLIVPGAKKEHVIMSGVSGAVMAFAPGWHDGTVKPGEPGISLIAAHMDTHFDYLKRMSIGDLLELQTAQGIYKTYRVEDMIIVQDPEIRIPGSEDDSVLVLSTSYPFSNWQLGGKMRFVVIAREEHEIWASL